jgi:hypothetical protein
MNVEISSISLDGMTQLTQEQKDLIVTKAFKLFRSTPLYMKSPDKVLEFLDYLAEKHGTTRDYELILYITRLKEIDTCKPRTSSTSSKTPSTARPTGKSGA